MLQLSSFKLCLTVLLSLYITYAIPQSAVKEDEAATVSCSCGNHTLTQQISMNMVGEIIEQIEEINSNTTNLMNYPPVIRDFFRKCSSCDIIFTECDGQSDSCKKDSIKLALHRNETYKSDYKDLMRYVSDKISLDQVRQEGSTTVHIVKRNILRYPIQVHIPIGGLKKRFRRQRESCYHPTMMHTAQLDCVYYPRRVTCIQTCAHGYTLPHGRIVEYNCKRSQNIWTPGNFRECQPFIDCTISLVSGGRASCTSPGLHRGPVCDIRCSRFEDMLSTQITRHGCDEEGNWIPRLPFCAHRGSGIDLVPRPDVEMRKHSKVSVEDNNEECRGDCIDSSSDVKPSHEIVREVEESSSGARNSNENYDLEGSYK